MRHKKENENDKCSIEIKQDRKSRRRSTTVSLFTIHNSLDHRILFLCVFFFFFFPLLHWCKDHSILSPTASHYDLLNWFVYLYVIHHDMRPCGRTSRARQGGLTGEYSIDIQSILKKICEKIPHAISRFIILWFTREFARIRIRNNRNRCR